MPDNITVRILEARNLLAADRGGLSFVFLVYKVKIFKDYLKGQATLMLLLELIVQNTKQKQSK